MGNYILVLTLNPKPQTVNPKPYWVWALQSLPRLVGDVLGVCVAFGGPSTLKPRRAATVCLRNKQEVEHILQYKGKIGIIFFIKPSEGS